MTQSTAIRFGVGVLSARPGLSAPAFADCGDDMQKLAQDAQRRTAEDQRLRQGGAWQAAGSGGVLRQVGRASPRRDRAARLYGKEQGLVLVPDEAIDNLKTAPRQERRLHRQGLHGRRENQEDEGAGGAGRRRRAAGPAAAGRAALTVEPSARGPAGRAARRAWCCG